MPAAATARKPAARAPAPATRRPPRPAQRRTARPAPRAGRRPASRPGGLGQARLVPVAVGRTAVAVGGLADSGVVFGLTRSRLWIGLLAGLLVGIVGLNVAALQLNAGTSKTAALSEELLRENSALRAEIADQLSNERLQRAAARLGLAWPEPTAIRYLDPRSRDAAAAAARLRSGEITVGASYVPAVPVVALPPVEPVTPVLTEGVPAEAPAEAGAPAPAPAEATAATSEPAATEPVASEPAPAAGGIAP